MKIATIEVGLNEDGSVSAKIGERSFIVRSRGAPSQSGTPAATCIICDGTKSIGDNNELECPACAHVKTEPLQFLNSSTPTVRWLIKRALLALTDSEEVIGNIERSLRKEQEPTPTTPTDPACSECGSNDWARSVSNPIPWCHNCGNPQEGWADL